MKHLRSSIQVSRRGFYIPKKEDFPLTEDKLNKWYSNLLAEISQNNYPESALVLLQDKKNYYGKYLEPKTREFFLNHFARNLTMTINFIYNCSNRRQEILEIGSGCGNQLLLLAFLGAEAYGCDIRYDVCDLMKKRKKFYEKISGCTLNISLICEDVFRVDWDEFPKFDAVNFLFSFNDVMPSQRLIELVTRLIKPHGRLVIQDTNQSNYFNRIFRRRASMLPQQVAKALELHDFKIHSLQGGYAVPPIFWNILPRSILSSIDQILCRSLFMSPSYQLMAEKL